MAKRYTATAQLHVWKQHTCGSCAYVYAYIMERKVAGTGGSPEGAGANLKKRLEAVAKDDTDMQPCPNCGHYQQDMIGFRLARRRKIVALLTLLMPILLPILRGTHLVQANTLTWLAVLYCLAALAVHVVLSRWDPNRDREANRRVAVERAALGVLQLQPREPGQIPVEPKVLPRPTQAMGHTIVLAVLLGAVVLAVLPELLRGARGWPLNGDCYPTVVGPGDATRVYMNESITSIKGYWRGSPNVTLDAGDGRAPRHVDASANDNDWGQTITAKSDEKNNHSRPWVEMTIPSAAELAGQTVTCHVELRIEYPQLMGTNKFAVQRERLARDVTIQLAPPGAGAQYNGLWWAFTMGALGVVLAGSVALVLLARRYQRQARPTQVFPVAAVADAKL